MSLLTVNKVYKTFGGLSAVSNVNMDIHPGELIGLIGPNGAGKTTFFNLITGVYVPTSGTISLDLNGGKKVLNKLKPYEITGLGIARTFQNIRLFKDLSVIDNITIAMHKNVKYGIFPAIIRTPSFKNEEKTIYEKAYELLKIFNLESKKDEFAKNLSYGEQRRLEITRALATEPKFLLLDEPAAGMNPNETSELTELIKFIQNKFNLTIMLIEHDMSLVMKICERIYVLDYGTIIAEGKPEEIKKNKKVLEAYLGEEVEV